MPFYWTTKIPDNGWYWVRIKSTEVTGEVVRPMLFKNGDSIELSMLKTLYQKEDFVLNYSDKAIREPVKEKKY